MDTVKTSDKCRALGICRLPPGHTGICVFGPADCQPPTSGEIFERHGQVAVDFGVTGPWQVITFSPKQALEFGAALVRRGYKLLMEQASGEVHH